MSTGYTDTYWERLSDLIDTKAAGGEYTPAEREATEEVGDLLAALEASIQRRSA